MLRILITGGTFDKHYDELAGKLIFANSHLFSALARGRVTLPTQLEIVTMVDSLDMNDEDRAFIRLACQRAEETALVIIHGTDTMCKTAHFLGNAMLAKTIILTGALIPYEVANSDALFNLGFACGVAQTLPHGVYIAMNGQIFHWDKVKKNPLTGVFEQAQISLNLCL
ncbi:MAG: putative Asparaginase/glutaminase [Solimicrobium sp.]|jgi:L-asparaginase|nr:putative Asparaginase/glutaminase [Solimicrobium sp.]